jgi:hypothetical protein
LWKHLLGKDHQREQKAIGGSSDDDFNNVLGTAPCTWDLAPVSRFRLTEDWARSSLLAADRAYLGGQQKEF